MVHFNQLDNSHLSTAEFCEASNNAFDVCNSSSPNDAGYKRVITKNFLDEAGAFLKSLVFLPTDEKSAMYQKRKLPKEMPFQLGWQISIASLKALSKMLIEKYDFKFVRLRQFKQDHVENCFSQIRGKNGFNDKPEMRSFRGALKSVCVNSLLHPNTSSSTNCENDHGHHLITIDEKFENVQQQDILVVQPPEGIPSDAPLTEVEEDVLKYIGGYCLKQCDKCLDCKKLILRPNGNKEGVFLNFKEFKHINVGLLSLTEDANNAIEKLEKIFRLKIDTVNTQGMILHSILQEAADILLPVCEFHFEEHNNSTKKLFFKLRLHSWSKSQMLTYKAQTERLAAERKMNKLRT